MNDYNSDAEPSLCHAHNSILMQTNGLTVSLSWQVLVNGASSDFFESADTVICMDSFAAKDVTADAHAICQRMGSSRRAAAPVPASRLQLPELAVLDISKPVHLCCYLNHCCMGVASQSAGHTHDDRRRSHSAFNTLTAFSCRISAARHPRRRAASSGQGRSAARCLC